MITIDDVNAGIFQDAMNLLVRYDFREAEAFLKVEYDVGGKYDTPKTRFILCLRVIEPEMAKAIYGVFPDSRFWSEDGRTYSDGGIRIHLKRPIPKEEPAKSASTRAERNERAKRADVHQDIQSFKIDSDSPASDCQAFWHPKSKAASGPTGRER
jgi:hypothetical protein